MGFHLSRAAYRDLLSLARRHARGRVEAEDLLQDALAVALAADRPISAENRAWMGGVMRNLSLMHRRGAARRVRREQLAFAVMPRAATVAPCELPALDALAPSLRLVALLSLSGHSRAEIRSLLRISDEALRQRVAGVRRHLRKVGVEMPREFCALRGSLAFGSIRRSLLPLMRAGGADLASHDPDGHLLAFRIRRPAAHETAAGGNRRMQPG